MDSKRLGIISAVYAARWGATKEGLNKAATISAALSNFLDTVDALNACRFAPPVNSHIHQDWRPSYHRINFALKQKKWLGKQTVARGSLINVTGGVVLDIQGTAQKDSDFFYGGSARYSASSSSWEAAVLRHSKYVSRVELYEEPTKTDLNGFLVRVLMLVP